MRQVHQNQIHFNSLKLHSALKRTEQGIITEQTIRQYEIVMTIDSAETICFSNIPSHFKQQASVTKQATFKQTGLDITHSTDYPITALMLYLIHLKQTKPLAIYQQWLNRKVGCLFSFDKQVITVCNNVNLLIDYVAENNYLEKQAFIIYQILFQKNRHFLEKILNKNANEQQFVKLYRWAYQFLNNRSFGYTDEVSLIPYFDYVNHSSQFNLQLIVLPRQQISKQTIVRLIEQKKDKKVDDDCDSDNDEDAEEQKSTTNQIQQSKSELCYVMVAVKQIQPKQQLTLRYGNRNNLYLLKAYGFVQINNPYDSCVLYFDLLNPKIYYDKINCYSQSTKKFRIKRQQFNFELFITAKKYYYSKYYNKDASKSKILWSVPKDLQFEQYFAIKMLERLQDNSFIVHQIDNHLLGSKEMMLWQQQQSKIVQNTIQCYKYYLNQIMKKKSCNSFKCSEIAIRSIPKQLKEYISLLNQL